MRLAPMQKPPVSLPGSRRSCAAARRSRKASRRSSSARAERQAEGGQGLRAPEETAGVTPTYYSRNVRSASLSDWYEWRHARRCRQATYQLKDKAANDQQNPSQPKPPFRCPDRRIPVHLVFLRQQRGGEEDEPHHVHEETNLRKGHVRISAFRVLSGPPALSRDMVSKVLRRDAAVLSSPLHQEGFGPPTCCSSKVAKRCGQPATKGDFP